MGFLSSVYTLVADTPVAVEAATRCGPFQGLDNFHCFPTSSWGNLMSIQSPSLYSSVDVLWSYCFLYFLCAACICWAASSQACLRTLTSCCLYSLISVEFTWASGKKAALAGYWQSHPYNRKDGFSAVDLCGVLRYAHRTP